MRYCCITTPKTLNTIDERTNSITYSSFRIRASLNVIILLRIAAGFYSKLSMRNGDDLIIKTAKLLRIKQETLDIREVGVDEGHLCLLNYFLNFSLPFNLFPFLVEKNAQRLPPSLIR